MHSIHSFVTFKVHMIFLRSDPLSKVIARTVTVPVFAATAKCLWIPFQARARLCLAGGS
jgi:hypothetical protein